MQVANPFGFLGRLTDDLQTAVQGFRAVDAPSSPIRRVHCRTEPALKYAADSSLVLGGCGAEVAGTAATAASVKAAELQAAQQQKAQFDKKLGEAMKATVAAASAAGDPPAQ